MPTDFGVHESCELPLHLCADSLSLLNYSCDMEVIVNENNANDTKDFITKRLVAIKNQRKTGEQEDLALIIGEEALFLSPSRARADHCVHRWEISRLCPRERSFEDVFGVGHAMQSCDLL